VGLLNSNLSQLLSCLFIGSGDVATHKHNRQLLLSPFAMKLVHFLKKYTDTQVDNKSNI